MEVFAPSLRTKEAGQRKVISCSGWEWERVRVGGDSLD